jgi:hypothetical protein
MLNHFVPGQGDREVIVMYRKAVGGGGTIRHSSQYFISTRLDDTQRRNNG